MDNFSNDFMNLAILEAQKAFELDEVPVGAIITKNGELVAVGHNSVINDKSISSHAEIVAINNASKILNNYRLVDCDLYVTLEPCHMCAKAIIDARINHLYFGCFEPKSGAIQSIDNFFNKKFLNHQTNFSGGIKEEECKLLLTSFFQRKRK